MSSETRRSSPHRVHRREFLGVGTRTAVVLGTLPMASLLVGCGADGERADGAAGRAPANPRPEAATEPRAEAKPRPAPAPASTTGEEDPNRLVTELASAAAIVNVIQYVNQSPKPDQNCANCQLYTAVSGGRGKCQLFAKGLVAEMGWCASWVAKAS